MKTQMSKLALAIGAVVMVGSAWSATDSATLTVGAAVSNSCAIGTGYLNFGNLTMLVTSGAGTRGYSSVMNASQSVPVICTNGASAAITADLGTFASGSTRRMASGSDRLAYELFTDATRGVVLDSSYGSIPYTGTGAADYITIYGSVTAASVNSVKKGDYEDVVALTITYTP